MKLLRVPLWLWLLLIVAGLGYAFHPYVLEQLNQLEQKRLSGQYDAAATGFCAPDGGLELFSFR
jgi:hypothetical protein